MAKKMEDNVLEGVAGQFRVLLENTPNWKDVSTGKVERGALIESPAVGGLVAVLSGVGDRESAQSIDNLADIWICSSIFRQRYPRKERADVPFPYRTDVRSRR